MSNSNPAVGIDRGTTKMGVSVQTDSTGPVVLEIPQPINERSHLESISHIKSAVFFAPWIPAIIAV
jgi:molecular chaperone DnaK (HSP70)